MNESTPKPIPDQTRVAQARQAALVRSAAEAPTLARDVTLARVLLAERRAAYEARERVTVSE